MTNHTHILIFSIGPVQSFIAEARRTVDLSNGSYMLVEVARSAAQAVDKAGGQLIFPTARALKEEVGVPNVLVALVANPKGVADKAVKAAKTRWQNFADDAQESLLSQDDPLLREIWQRQQNNHLEFYWIAAPYTDNNYAACYKKASEALAARKRTRNFDQVHEDGPKDSLSGSRSALRTSKSQNKAQAARDYWSQMRAKTTAAELQEGELLDTIGAMKRFAIGQQGFPSTSTVATTCFVKNCNRQNLAELVAQIKAINEKIKNIPPDIDYGSEEKLQAARHFFVAKKDYLRQIGNFADPNFPYGGDLLYEEGWARERLAENYGKLPESVYEQLAQEIASAKEILKLLHQDSPVNLVPYYAILQMDGDRMGKHISQCQKLAEHQQLSARLAEFTKAAGDIVQKNHGYLVYAGGDDVLAFFPVETALAAAGALVKAYQGKFEDWSQKDEDGNNLPFTASAGIAFAHYLYPLDAVLAATRRAEKQAKNKYDRDALCVTVLRRSGETLEVGGKWGDDDRLNTVKLVNELKVLFDDKQLPSRFPYNVLRDAPVVTEMEDKQQARPAILRQLVNRHKTSSVTNDKVKELVENWVAWANQYDDQVPSAPDSRKKQDQGFYELARWFVLARWLAVGGQE